MATDRDAGRGTGLAALREALERQVESRRTRLGREAGAIDDADDPETTLRRHADRSVRSARRVGVEELARLLEMSAHGGDPTSEGARAAAHLATGWSPIDALLGGGLRLGALHEWEGAGLAPLLVLTHLARRALDAVRTPDGARAGGSAIEGAGGLVLWIGRTVWPSIAWLSSDPSVLRASVLVDDLAPPERLWAIDLALRAGGVPPAARTVVAVIADGKGFDLAATRRLQLAAERGGGLALLVRSSAERGVLSAATTRWRVTAARALRAHTRSVEVGSSADLDAAGALPPPSRSIGVRIELLRRKGLRPTRVTNPTEADGGPGESQHDVGGGEAGWFLERIDAASDLVVAPRLAR